MEHDPDQRMAEEIRRVYAPEPPSAARRAALRAGIDARIERRSRPNPKAVLAGVLGLAAVVLVAWLIVRPAPARDDTLAVTRAADRWVEEMLFGAEESEVTIPLPGEYAALSELLER